LAPARPRRVFLLDVEGRALPAGAHAIVAHLLGDAQREFGREVGLGVEHQLGAAARDVLHQAADAELTAAESDLARGEDRLTWFSAALKHGVDPGFATRRLCG